MTDAKSNNPPDVILELTHEQASFLLDNCKSNLRLGLAMIMSFQHDPGTLEQKRAKAEKYVKLQDQFSDMMKLLRKAGAKDND